MRSIYIYDISSLRVKAGTETTQQSGQTRDKEVEIKNITVLSAATLKGQTVGGDNIPVLSVSV